MPNDNFVKVEVKTSGAGKPRYNVVYINTAQITMIVRNNKENTESKVFIVGETKPLVVKGSADDILTCHVFDGEGDLQP